MSHVSHDTIKAHRERVILAELRQGPRATRELAIAAGLRTDHARNLLDYMASDGHPVLQQEIPPYHWRYAPEYDRPSQAAVRRCLGAECGVYFQSHGPQNRLCPKCRGVQSHARVESPEEAA